MYHVTSAQAAAEIMRLIRCVMKDYGASSIMFRESSDHSGDVNLMEVGGKIFDYDNEPKMVATIDAIVDATVKNGPALLEVLKDDGKVTSAWNLDMEWTVSL